MKIGANFKVSSYEYSIVLVWTSLTVTTVWCQQGQFFLTTPASDTVLEGSRHTLGCVVVHRAGIVDWLRDGIKIENFNGFERYKMLGVEKGDYSNYSLVIESVEMEDDAIFECQVSSGFRGGPDLRSRGAKLTVHRPPTVPTIQNSLMTENVETELICNATGNPPPILTWLDLLTNQELTDGTSNVLQVTQIHTGKFKSHSILQFIPQSSDHNRSLLCSARNLVGEERTEIKLSVNYRPLVRIQIVPAKIWEIYKLKILCEADGNPNTNFSYKWFINGDLVPRVDKTLTLRHLTKNQDNVTVIECSAQNFVGVGRTSPKIFDLACDHLNELLIMMTWLVIGLTSLIIILICLIGILLCHKPKKRVKERKGPTKSESMYWIQNPRLMTIN